MPDEIVEAFESLPTGPFDGREAFRSMVLRALDAAAREGWRELILSDPDFSDWPLGDRAVVDALQAWAGPGRSFVLLAERFNVFEREHARFVRWRQMWSHIIDCRACRGPGAPQVPSAIWTPTWFMRRIDIAHCRGVSGQEAPSRRAMREALDECLRQGRAGFPASTLGL